MFGVGIAHGKFGELLQGVSSLHDRNFSIALPITNLSRAEFQYNASTEFISIFPNDKTKSLSIIRKMLDHLQFPGGGRVKIVSQLDVGKGLGSSSADMLACVRAVMCATDKRISYSLLLSLLREIEPTDGIMFNQMACFDHKNVTNYGLLGTLPMLTVIAVDEGGAVDTVAFNQENRVHSHAVKIEYDRLRIDIQVAIKICDLRRVGEISTRSAQLIQKWNPKNHLNLFIDLCKDTDALGIVVAHSGTYIGLLLDKREESYCSQKNKVFTRLQEQGLSPKVFSTLPKADVIAQEKVDMEASLDFFYE